MVILAEITICLFSLWYFPSQNSRALGGNNQQKPPLADYILLLFCGSSFPSRGHFPLFHISQSFLILQSCSAPGGKVRESCPPLLATCRKVAGPSTELQPPSNHCRHLPGARRAFCGLVPRHVSKKGKKLPI